MATARHVEPELQLELSNLERTIACINKKIAELQQQCETRKTDIVEFRKQFWADITIDPNDLLETYASISQQSMLLNSEEKTYLRAVKQLQLLQKIAASPYFGRFDFSEDDSGSPSRFYIGTISVLDEETEQFLVYDWRSPIAAMYYDYGVGSASYTAPDGIISGVVSLKRQYLIHDGTLQHMFETDVHIRDEMLLAMLSRGTDEKLRSIAATIQKEQNEIIRNEKHRVLLVQGAAGSGKTTAALHRIAYLLYKYRDSLSEEQFILFSPNPIFTDYISNVLPDLGESNVKQTTFIEYKRELLGGEWTVEHPYEQLERMLTSMHEADASRMESAIRFKTSPLFQTMIDRYVDLLGREGIKFRDMYAGGNRLLSGNQMTELFYGEWSRHPIPKRISLIQAHAEKELVKLRGKLVKQLLAKTVKSAEYWEGDSELLKQCTAEISSRLIPLKALLHERNFIDYKRLYLRLFQDPGLPEKLIGTDGLPADWDQIRTDTIESMESGNIQVEDSTPYLYLRYSLGGIQPANTIKHIVIDEAQDYSGFDYELLRRLLPNCKMTLLGDVHQSIYAHTRLELEEPGGEAGRQHQTGVLRLDKSYRSTAEIVSFTSSLLPQSDSIRPFGRNGGKPEWIVLSDHSDESIRRQIVSDCERLQRGNVQSIAIICRTAKESEHACALLQPHIPGIRQLTKETRSYEGKCFVAPVYFAKGLEFDGVIVYDIARYGRESERSLLYTACTRALHSLLLYDTAHPSRHPLLKPDTGLVDILYR
ncbi:RNA polymerase recycling motor HelD [Paenibacillus mesophilus]|uniref:RNA polymerase recycling motor HelD n=1 Tax=Paenibacillus mesophilus TaxID=2582849 RepID=UPI0013051B76|nr:RNA polymerase recycling motor HelD [Paenibacillus mesophilus]